jgi:O-antigen ligase
MTARTLGLPLDRERSVAPQVRESRPGELAVAVVASVLGGCALVATGGWVAFALFGVAFFAALGVLRPALFLGLVVLVRPLLDQFTGVTLGVPSANVGGALALLLIAAAVLDATRRRRVTWPRAAAALLIALAVSAVSALQALLTIGPAIGTEPIAEVIRIGALLAAYVLAANVFDTPEKVRRLFVVAGLCGVVPGLLGLVEWISGPPVVADIGLPRISGPFVGPIPFGAFLAVSALILLFLPRDQLRPSLRIPALLAVCAPLVGTLSREAWVIFLGGVVLMGWRARKSAVVGVVLVTVALLVLVPTVRERALPAGPPDAGAPVQQAYGSWTWRTKNWETLLGEWRKQPVFGYGLQSTIWVNPRTPVTSQGEPGGGFDAHSLAVRLLVEGGVVMLIAYAAFFVVLMRSTWRLAHDSWELQPLARLLFVIWALLLVVGVTTDDPFDGTAVMIPLFALTGGLEAVHRTSAQAASAR